MPPVLRVGGLELTRTQSPPSLACWTGYLPGSADADAVAVSVVVEPAAPPGEGTLLLVRDVVGDFEVFVSAALEYCRVRLRETGYELTAEELGLLELPELPLAAPEATVWADGTWALRFAECGLRLGDPYGVLVTFDGRRPVDLHGVDGE